MLRERVGKPPAPSPGEEKKTEPPAVSEISRGEETSSVKAESVSVPPTEAVADTAPAAAELPPVDSLKDQVLGALRRVRHSLAAAMEKAELWNISGNILTLTFRTAFEISFLEKERHEIEKIILEKLNYSLQLKTELRKHEEESVHNEVEEQVELVRSVFRGTIMKRSKS